MSGPEALFIPLAVFGFPAIASVAFRWFKHRERMASTALAADPQQTAALEARLARMEQTLDAVAVEVERVSEGQRFVTRLLAERATPALGDPSLGARARVNTPH